MIHLGQILEENEAACNSYAHDTQFYFSSVSSPEKLIHAFISRRVDCCCGLLSGFPKNTI